MRKSLVLGFFDGVHKAHKAVIRSAFEYSDNVTVITFDSSPSEYFGDSVEYVLSRDNSVKKLYKLGVKSVEILEFAKIAKMEAKDYIEYLCDTYNPISISTGFNHTFGANKSGNPNFLRLNENKYKYKYICVPPFVDKNEVVSSSLIREYLINGNIKRANYLLDSNFIIEGTVIHGAEIGRTIGFPTANINYPYDIVKIPYGVYGVLVSILPDTDIAVQNPVEKCMPSIMNWGMKPTVNNTNEPIAEIHIPNFNGDLYGKKLRVEVIEKIRPEQKFKNLDELKIQIGKDIETCLKLS